MTVDEQEFLQCLLDDKVSDIWDTIRYHGFKSSNTKDWFAGTDIFIQILQKIEEENV